MANICIKESITAHKLPQNSETRNHLIDVVMKGLVFWVYIVSRKWFILECYNTNNDSW